MQRKISLLFFSVMMFIAIAGCQSGAAVEPPLTPEDEAFAQTYAEVLLVNAVMEQLPDSAERAFNKPDSLRAVFASRKADPKLFWMQMEQFIAVPKKWQQVQRRTTEILESRRAPVAAEVQVYERKVQDSLAKVTARTSLIDSLRRGLRRNAEPPPAPERFND
ncbi:MAG: hypothetical protein IAF08_10845 [Rhizobacter sp.]|nr:hypothetical protein [Chlorobiales bacterium]